MRLPGFRQGKVPTELVRRRFAKDIDQEVKERLLPRYWRQAQAESSIEPLLPPEVDEVPDLVPGEPLTFIATVETRPADRAAQHRATSTSPTRRSIPGTMEIEETMENLRKQVSEWVPVERPASRGDQVSLEVTTARARPSTPRGADRRPSPDRIEVGDPQVWEELSLAVRGSRPARRPPSTAATSTTPAEEGGSAGGRPRADVPGEGATRSRSATCRRSTTRFAAKVNPEFDDLRRSSREAVTERLRQSKDEQRREARHRALLDQLRDRHPLELPQGVVRKEVEGLVQDYAEYLSRRGVDLDKANIDWNAGGRGDAPLAERRVHARLLLDAIADAESIAVTEEEFERALAVLARAQTPRRRCCAASSTRTAG